MLSSAGARLDFIDTIHMLALAFRSPVDLPLKLWIVPSKTFVLGRVLKICDSLIFNQLMKQCHILYADKQGFGISPSFDAILTVEWPLASSPRIEGL